MNLKPQINNAMKKVFVFAAIIGSIALSSCSQCYECSYYTPLADGNGNVIDSTTVVEDICTASTEEITSREADGQTCMVK